jgi:plasmid stabilization system protein ParE
MEIGVYEVVWTRLAQLHMRNAYEYISKDAPKNAVKVLEDIVKAVHKADKNPAYYNADKYKISNDGSYRAFEKHKYRIVYRFTGRTIRVLRIRHTKMEPKKY